MRGACVAVVGALVVAASSGCGDDEGAPRDAAGRDGGGRDASGADAAGFDARTGDDAAAGDAGTGLPAIDWRDAVVYHLYVRRFDDADGDGQGDYAGLRARLDHLADLGVDAVLLLPIVDVDLDDTGGYTPIDFRASEPSYGDLAAFEALAADLHARGMRLLIDLPLDLAGPSHPWFVEARGSRSAAHHDWFAWHDAPCPSATGYFGPGWAYVAGVDRCYWAKWGDGSEGSLPEWSYDHPDVRAEMIGVGRHWLAHGADGFRLDSAHALDDEVETGTPDLHSPGTHAFWSEFNAAMRSARPDYVAVAEVSGADLGRLEAYFADGTPMIFDYPLFHTGLGPAVATRDRDALAAALEARATSVTAGRHLATFLGNHDVWFEAGRIADVVGGSPARLTQLAALYLSLPGTPFVYYGEELGMRGDPSESQSVRNWMDWTAAGAQRATSGSMLSTYRALIRIRHESEALRRGTFRSVRSASPHVLGFLRESGTERLLIVINLGATPERAALDLAGAGITTATVTDRIFGLPAGTVEAATASSWGPELAADGVLWLSVN